LSAGKVHRRRPEKPVQGHAPAATRNVDVRCDRLAPVPQCRAQAHSEPSSLRAKRDLGENCKPRWAPRSRAETERPGWLVINPTRDVSDAEKW